MTITLIKDEYVFRYKVEPAGTLRGRDLPNEMIRIQLRNLLDLVILCANEREVKIDGYRLISSTIINKIFKKNEEKENFYSQKYLLDKDENNNKNSKFSYQNIRNAAFYEPRIELIKKQLETILSLVELESEGKVVKIDGFRLKNLNDWVVSSKCDPQEIFEHLGTRCNCNCIFCYNKGVPPSLALQYPQRTVEEEWEEIKTRLKYYLPSAKRSLFPSIGSTCEVLAHPYALKVLSQVREKTSKPFRLATNGANLTSKIIKRLVKLAPVYLDFSLNSSSPWRRSKLMRDKKPEIAINAVPMLKSAGIPYSIVIVPWPLDNEKEMLKDLENTVAYVAEHDVNLVQISLPGYSKYFSSRKLFDHESIWRMVVAKVQELREKYDCPIVLMPGIYEEKILRPKKNIAEVIGVVKNSPAAFAGLQRGDIIKRIAGIIVHNRPQARILLSHLQQGEIKTISIVIERNYKEFTLNLDLTKYFYPYLPETSSHLGIIFMGTGFRVGYLERLRDIIRSCQAKDVLLLSSRLVKPVLEQCLSECSYFLNINFEIGVPENHYFGGNILMGDLLVVEDFIMYIKEYISFRGKKPELVVIPSSPFNLSGWGRDLTGRCYLDIEREVGFPVRLLECETIYD